MKNLIERAKAPTPKFWKDVQKIGLAITAIGTLITAAPGIVPASLAAWGTYLITAGGTIAGLSQLTKE